MPKLAQILERYGNDVVFLFCSLYKTNRLHVAVRLFSSRSQRTSKCCKNFLPHFDVICDLSLNRRTLTWTLFVKRFTCKITWIISSLLHCIHRHCFYRWNKLKNVHFRPKMAWPPTSFDVISRNHRNCSSLNLSADVDRLGKTSEKPHSGGGGAHLPSTRSPSCTSEG